MKSPEAEAAWAFYMEGTMSIEILKDDVLQKIYFRVKDKVRARFCLCFFIEYFLHWYSLLLLFFLSDTFFIGTDSSD